MGYLHNKKFKFCFILGIVISMDKKMKLFLNLYVRQFSIILSKQALESFGQDLNTAYTKC